MKTAALIVISLLGLVFHAPVMAQDPNDRTLSSQGDAEAGRLVFLKCQACHTLDNGGTDAIGPNLANIFGRMAATSNGYAGYSKALRESGIVWNEVTLNEWMDDPQNFLPGNKMPFAGIRSEQDRKDLLAFLRQATETQ